MLVAVILSLHGPLIYEPELWYCSISFCCWTLQIPLIDISFLVSAWPQISFNMQTYCHTLIIRSVPAPLINTNCTHTAIFFRIAPTNSGPCFLPCMLSVLEFWQEWGSGGGTDKLDNTEKWPLIYMLLRHVILILKNNQQTFSNFYPYKTNQSNMAQQCVAKWTG